MFSGSKNNKDRRLISRIPAQLSCTFTYEGISRPAIILDISHRGALISSNFLPPKDCQITITIEPPHSQRPITLTGIVVRGWWGKSREGDVSRFGIRISDVSSGFIGLLHGLISKAAAKPSEKAGDP